MDPSFLVIDKPPGLTSHDVVGIVRAVTGEKRIGHTGTLDPFATGVLALAIGPATRLIQYLDESLKVYDATIGLGTATTTGDPEGEPLRTAPVPELSLDPVRAVLDTFLGARMQRPPAYSAVKVKGKPLYAYARAGQEVEATPRPITIHGLEILALEPGSLRILIRCSRGTYARVLAEEIAVALGTEGHLTALARRQSGPFLLDDAVSLDAVARWTARDDVGEAPEAWRRVFRAGEGGRAAWRPRDEVRAALRPFLRSPMQALGHLPILDVDAEGARRVRNGGVPAGLPPGLRVGGRYLIAWGDQALAVAESGPRGARLACVIGRDA